MLLAARRAVCHDDGMCIICVEYQKEKMTRAEAHRVLGEMRSGLGEHAKEVEELLGEEPVEDDEGSAQQP